MNSLSDHDAVKARARISYDEMEEIWPGTDDWSIHTQRSLALFINEFISERHQKILNAGSGNSDYSLPDREICVNLDLSLRQCWNMKQAVVGDIESIRFRANSFHAVICVGAVLNYTEPYDAIPELIRVTEPEGLRILDFETTHTAELLFTPNWAKRASIIERNYAGRLDKTFLFSTEHIRRILESYGTKINALRRYHTATAIWRRVFPDSPLPDRALKSDHWVSRIPMLRSLASNVIVACRKG